MEALFVFFFTLFIELFTDVQSDTVIDASPDAVTAEVVSVTDGDTITVLLDGKREKVRYIGVDTPEPYRDGEPACFSKEASSKNQSLVQGKMVTLVPDVENRDRFDRLLRYVYVDDVFVNEVLVREGYATTLTIKPNTQNRELLDKAESAARQNAAGLWGECNS